MKRLLFSSPWPFLPSALSIFILLACATALPADEPNEAEKLFRDMEKKINSAKTIEFRFEGKTEFKDKDNNGEFKYTLLLGEGNKCYLEGSMKVVLTYKGAAICDGKKLVITEGKAARVADAPKDLNVNLRFEIARLGLIMGSDLALYDLRYFQPKSPNYKAKFFRLGEKEKIGGKEAQEIRYTVATSGVSEISVNLWLDAKTNLPLKRVSATSDVGVFSGKTITEMYDLILDGKIDDKKFELPKE